MKRAAAHHATAALRLLAALALLAPLAGCNRKPQLVPRSADSTATAPADSFSLVVRDVQQRWEAGDDNEQAASASARLLLADFTARPAAALDARARTLLDSLGVGGEIAGGGGAVAVNLFSRADPEGDSWPWLFWREGGKARAQAIEGRGLHLAELAARDPGTDSAQVAAIFARRAGGGQQPLLMVWGRQGSRWELRQTLGADSLGGTGSAAFEGGDDRPDLVARTHRNTPRFEECATCPHIYHTLRFTWGTEGFARVSDEMASSPYAAFVQLIQALLENDRDAAERLVTERRLVDQARKAEWNKSKGVWRAAPATDEAAQSIVFFRGTEEAWRVSFEQRGGEWRMSGFEATSRTIE